MDGYEPLVVEIVKFFKTGKPPVSAEETIEIFAFMEAADESKRQGGRPVTIESVMSKAKSQRGKPAITRGEHSMSRTFAAASVLDGCRRRRRSRPAGPADARCVIACSPSSRR